MGTNTSALRMGNEQHEEQEREELLHPMQPHEVQETLESALADPKKNRQECDFVLDDCIAILKEVASQDALRLAGSKQIDIHTALIDLLVKNGIGSKMAVWATTISHDTHSDDMQRKVEKILHVASRAWHGGLLQIQKEKLKVTGSRAILRTNTERFVKEMHDTQQSVAKLMASLQPKEQAVRKHQLLTTLRLQRQQWQQRLSIIPESDQTNFLLNLPADERVSICRMNLILKMAETEARQISQTGATIQANEVAASESIINNQK